MIVDIDLRACERKYVSPRLNKTEFIGTVQNLSRVWLDVLSYGNFSSLQYNGHGYIEVILRFET